MSRRKRAAKEPEVRWEVTNRVLGGLTIQRVIELHHFMPFTSDRDVLGLPLEAYKPPTDNDPWWVVRATAGATWRMQWRGAALGWRYEIWWTFEWRKRIRPPTWVRELGCSIEYGKRRRWGDDGVELPEPNTLPRPDEQQLILL